VVFYWIDIAGIIEVMVEKTPERSTKGPLQEWLSGEISDEDFRQIQNEGRALLGYPPLPEGFFRRAQMLQGEQEPIDSVLQQEDKSI
jgi:hypothetical protein